MAQMPVLEVRVRWIEEDRLSVPRWLILPVAIGWTAFVCLLLWLVIQFVLRIAQ